MNKEINENEVERIKSKFIHGHIKIQNPNGLVMNPDGSYYLNFKQNMTYANNGTDTIDNLSDQIRNIPKFMSTVWNLKSPQIIIPIITGITNFRNWKNKKLEESFRRGLMKAANKAEMWFITEGVNGGIPAMIGEAFNEEKVKLFSKKKRQ